MSRGPVAFLTINRPEAGNAMTWAMYDALVDACERVDADPAIRAVVIRAAGKTFCPGTDISQFTTFSTREHGIEYERRLEACVSRLERVAVPTIAQVEGIAAGGGCAIALACDLRVCSPAARFGVPIARTLGNGLSFENCARLVEHCGIGRARTMLLTGALSPFAPTGIIVNGIMAKNQMAGLETAAYLYNLGAHALMAFGGYALFGGLRLFAADRTAQAVDLDGARAFDRRHWITLGVIAALIISVLAFGAHVGLAAFVAAVLLAAAGVADDGEGIKLMPWRVIIMVSGVTVLIALVERFQGIDLMVSLVARLSTPDTVTGVVALITGIVSVYSSTSGVVLPAFLPLVPGLAAQLPGATATGIAMSMNIGGHLVDVSPLSTIGALCIASAGAGAVDTRRLFNQLLAWGLSMAVVGALLCYVLF